MKTKTAIAHFGTATRLAAALGISAQAIYQWGEQVPPLRVFQLREMGVPESAPNDSHQAPTREAAA